MVQKEISGSFIYGFNFLLDKKIPASGVGTANVLLILPAKNKITTFDSCQITALQD